MLVLCVAVFIVTLAVTPTLLFLSNTRNHHTTIEGSNNVQAANEPKPPSSVRGEKKKHKPGLKPGVSKRAASEAKTEKRLKKIQNTHLGGSQQTAGNPALTRHDNTVLGKNSYTCTCIVDSFNSILNLMKKDGKECMSEVCFMMDIGGGDDMEPKKIIQSIIVRT